MTEVLVSVEVYNRRVRCNYFNHIFHPFLAAFRSGFGCQSTLLRILEDWKKALDENKYVGAILMDLSKAFDCLPHDLLTLKMKHYGLSDNAVDLILSYLNNRSQCVKVGQYTSSFQDIIKGVPQGSILGPILFNIFINDIFGFVKHSTLYNYADDNTVSHADRDLEKLKFSLETDSESLINWFHLNKMQANPDKFQAIAIGNKTKDQNLSFKLGSTSLTCEDEVKLLGVTIDFKLDFNSHITNICKKAARQLNVLKRIGHHLSRLSKLTIYHSFILSNFSYCPLTWHFCSETNAAKIEKLQERALRFIYNDYNSSYHSLLEKSLMPSLGVRRQRTLAIETFKIINKSSPLFLHDLVNIKENSYNFRYTNMADIPRVRTTRYDLKSFRYAAPKIWNALPNDIRNCTSLNQFKNFISTWEGPTCRCTACRS